MNKNRLFGILVLIFVLFSAISIASASDIADDATFTGAESQNTLNLDEEINGISISDNSFTQLNDKIQSTVTGGTLTLDKNYTYSDGDIKTGIIINKDLTIDGRGYTLNGAGKASIFKISGSPHVVLKNINFINAYGDNGGALQLSADNNLEILNSKFINNVALANGGAISVENSSTITSTITISNSLFVNNNASNGGAISAKGTLLNVVDSNFNNNNASNDGGSIYLNVGAYVDRCSFINDYASHDGGAIFLNGIVNDMTALPEALLKKYGIFNSRFISCGAGHDGGASHIYANYGIVSNATVIGCSAGNMAGAGYIDGDRGRLTGSTFINNTAARDAGAVMWTGMNGMLVGCEFINNTAKFGDGAALYLQPADNVSVFDGISIVNCSTFINNSANFNGGAIYASGIFVVIHNSQFMGDTAREGAGIYLDVGASIEYCTFIGEYAKHNGGAIYLSASNIEYTDEDSGWMQILLDNIGVRHSTIVNCSADYDGGAGYVAGNYGIVANVTMIGNTAGHDGGAGYILGSYGKLYNSTMINNRAARDGGALMWAGNHGLVDNVTCMLNSARGGSGSVCVDGLNITILKSRFMLSNATLSGGAIYVYGDDATIEDSLFDRCAATAYHGGAVYVSGRNAHIHNCNFTMNRVNVGVGCGGAINIEGNGTHILNCNFDKCTAFEGGFVNIDGFNVLIENVTGMHSFAANGGAFYIDGDNVTIINVDFEYNNATQYAGAIYVEGDFANLTNIKLVRNIAYNRDGGAIYIAGSNTTITNANLVQNRVAGPKARGGAVYLQGDYTKIFNSTFDMCTAYDGGVIYINGSYSLIDGYSCIRSLALNDGGAIYVAGDYASIVDFNISLTNSTNYGGAIYVAGNNLNIHNSNFTKCTAYNHNGGAIYVLGKNTTLSKSSFVMNKVNTENGCGGSIAIHGNFTKIFNCTFERCTAYEGGVIYINGSNTLIDGYSCIMSFASNHGGAIFIEGDYASIADFNISLTNATNHGGAMYILGDFASIHNSNFTMCTADNKNGGALYVLGLNTTISESSFVMNKVNLNDGCGGSIAIHGNFTKILDCTFERCTAYDGGVIYINGSSTVIDGYSCLKSFAANNGGAIYVEGNNAYIADFDISLTNATNYGGAMYIEGDFATIHNSSFVRCIADNYDGGALYIAGLNATVSDSIFLQNKVNNISGRGGSIDINGNYTNLINCDFKMCSAYGGGVVNIEGSYANINGFTSNMTFATDKGGALYVAGDYVTVNNFTIGFCNVTNDGAAIYITGDDDVNILNGNLTTCIAVNGDGGAIYVGGYNTTVEGCNFDKTRALNGRGGAIFIEGDLARVEDSNFIRSFANDGGIIYISGHDADIINNNLTYSWAVDEGGAIYIEGHDVLIANTNFAFVNASNLANEYAGFGGALYIEGDNVNITNSTFLRCIAEKGGSGGAIFILGENVNIEYSNFTYCAAPDYLELGGGASAAGAIAIAGDDATVNGCYFQYATARNGAIMFIEGSNTSIINSTLLNSYADYDGGAIYIYGENTNISGTSFYKVRSERHGGAVYIRFGEYTNIEKSSFVKCNSTYGGAIDIDGSDVKISDSNLNDCYASTDGGAIYITGNNVTMLRSNFTNSFVDNGNGGVIYWVGSVGLVDESNFINNTAPRLGGAIFMKENSKITFQNSNFINNSAGINGGAIDFNRGAHDEIILNSTFENNVANRSAGAVFWFGTNGTIKNSNFTNNRALGIVNYTDSYGNVTYGGYGGAVMWTGAQGVVDNCIFRDNYAQYNNATKSGGRGGAVYLQGSDVGNGHDTAFYNSVFINNTAGYNGGAVDWFRGAANGRVENSTFINNTAHRSGGGIYWSGVNGTIKNSTFVNNTALGEITDANGGGDGGAVLWVGPQGNIETVNFTNNAAAYSGGAIYLKGSDNGTEGVCDNVSIKNGFFKDNRAGLNGGAITFQHGAMDGVLYNSTFINNTALRNGGSIFWYGHNGTIMECNFINNSALGLTDNDRRGVHQYVDENGNPVLGGSGGAIAWIGDMGNIDDSTFINNTAKRLGGGIFLRDNSNTIFANDKFINNTAGINGGAIDFNRGAHDGAIVNSTFENNIANRSAGAVFWFGTNGTIKNSNFTNNTALGLVEYNDSYGNLTYGGYGGAIMWTGANGIVDKCNFEDNFAVKRGGAVYLQGSDVGNCTNTTFNHCTFTKNGAGTNGGAVDWHEGAHDGFIYNSTFQHNTANANGGAVYWRGHDGQIIDSNFINNTAKGLNTGSYGNSGDGGAMFWAGINGTVENCIFLDNEAKKNPSLNQSGRGGAVYIEPCNHGNKNTTFRNVYFENNTAGTNGGAINWHDGAVDGLVDYGTFINNTAKRSGGAIFWNGHEGEIRYSKFYENKALGITNATSVRGDITSGGDGGAVMWSGAEGIVKHCDFENNTAAKRGGAVLLQGNEEYPCLNTVFTDNYFANNVAGTNGGAIDWYHGARNGIVDNSTFVNNTAKRAAGAIYWSGINGTVRNSNFIQNSALGNVTDVNGGGDGGAILWVGQNGKIENSKFNDNYAAFSGGAIFLKGTDDTFSGHCDNVSVSNSIFENNVAGLNGGAVTFQRGARNGLLSDSEFINNSAFRNGGAVFWYGTNGTLNNCSFAENNALGLVDDDSRGFYQYFDSEGNRVLGGSGGAVAWTGDIGSIKDSRFTSNTAARYGGAVFLRDNVNTTYDGSSFVNNSASHGGAIYWKSDSSVNLTNCILVGNIASKGSAIYLSHNMIEIINSIFMDNRADSVELTLNVSRTEDNHTIDIIATFKGNDNLMNAIWNEGEIALTNVTYLGVNGVANTGNERRIPVVLADGVKPDDYDSIYQTQYEDCQNITVYLYDIKNNLIATLSALTNISGVAKLSYTDNENTNKLYELAFHPQDTYYTGIKNSTSKGLVLIDVPVEDINYLENETFVIKVSDKKDAEIPTGNVTVLINGEELDIFNLSEGCVKITLNDLNAGTYNVTVKYSGDEKFFPEENSSIFKVMKIPSSIILTVENYTYGEAGKIIVYVPQNESGNVSVMLNGKTYNVKINESGYGELNIPKLTHGVYDVNALYPETNNYLKSVNSTVFEIYPLYNINLNKQANITGNASIGDLIKFTIIMSNDGSVNASNLNVMDKLPKYLKFVSAGSNSTYVGVKSVVDGFEVVTWDVGNFNADDKLMLWVIVKATLDGTFTNNVALNSTELNNVSNDVIVNVTPSVDLTVSKEVNTTSTIVGDEITYVITVSNNGPSNSTDVNVTEKLSKLVSLIKSETEFGYYDEAEGIWYVGNLANGTTATLTLKVKVIMQGVIENAVTVLSKEMDLNESNNKYASDNVTAVKSSTSMSIAVEDISYGEDGEIVVNLPEDATGTVNITVDGKTHEIPVENGVAKLTISDLSGGNHDVNIVYSGDNKYNSNSTDTKLNVAPIIPTIKIEVEDILFGEIEVLNVTVNAPGTVIITVDGVSIEIPLDEGVKTTDVLALANELNYDGKATWNLINLPLGAHNAFAIYKGNENYTSVNASAVFHVRDDVGDVSVILSDINEGDDEIINIKYPEDATGDVTIIINGKSYTKSLRNGEVTFTIPKLKAGKYKVDIYYSGDDKYLPEESEGSFKVSKVSKAKIKLTDDNIDFDGKKFTVTLPSDAKGTVTIEIDGKVYTKSVKDGKAVFELSGLKHGDYSIFVSYSGDDKYDEVSESFLINVDSDNGSGATHDGKSYSKLASEGVNLSDYATGNPVWILLLICVVIGLISPRRYRK